MAYVLPISWMTSRFYIMLLIVVVVVVVVVVERTD